MRIRTVVIALSAIFFLIFMAVRNPAPSPAESRATAFSPRKYANQAVKRAKFRSEVASARLAIKENDADLIERWNKAHTVSSCETIITLGYSSSPDCVLKEALQQELVERLLCKETDYPEICKRTIEVK
jgi:hypothetical protein